jgi:D-alanyl-lipoteichoic acid acyltransferase DltB (MBOAT superfamily)
VSRNFEYSLAVDGLRQILWGLFKKMVIADNCAVIANLAFNNVNDYNGVSLALGAVFFAIQIYCDFSGYSDIAIGVAKLFGINLLRNFAFPYFSRDMAEFWRRWHISLSSWFRDYLYIPLGGSRGNLGKTVRNVFIIFVVSGFWHGANWTFIVWGALNALFVLPLVLWNKNRTHLETVAQGRYLPTIKELFQMLLTFGLTTFAWIFFRAEDLTQALTYISRMFSRPVRVFPKIINSEEFWVITVLVIIFILVEWLGREGQHALERLNNKLNRPMRYAVYYVILMAIFWFGGREQQFIYFQF